MEMQAGKMHKILRPLCWIMGTWKPVCAVSEHPTKYEPRPFKEILSFTSLGQPQLKFDSISWDSETLIPLHIQNGYLYIDEVGKNVSLVTAHSRGFASVEVGRVKGCNMKLKNQIIEHGETTPKKITAFRREFSLNNKGQLVYKMMMQTEEDSQLFTHLKAVYEKSC
ncbi:peroxynitrite isomerase THAP4-like [Diabrotica virgifera virgifera]|uniref:THAP domain-containing protein 4-like n=1 Tax=Diabrotica virgifera virgifera TaxID=50390 RepID=A0A6P7H0H2_DIAVI|nr:peroxynitrite isomerase THAP4-like [Diabrotica virgifera virgifera]